MTEQELFVKMCDCPWIQGMWEPKMGDKTNKGYFWYKTIDEACVIIHRSLVRGRGYFDRDEVVWLPSIEQLMEMVRKDKKESDYSIHYRFNEWLHDFKPGGSNIIYVSGLYQQWTAPFNNNYPEMWLAFVMNELHNKRWSMEEMGWI